MRTLRPKVCVILLLLDSYALRTSLNGEEWLLTVSFPKHFPFGPLTVLASPGSPATPHSLCFVLLLTASEPWGP